MSILSNYIIFTKLKISHGTFVYLYIITQILVIHSSFYLTNL